MGHKLTAEQKETVYTTLDIDKDGKVVFSEFVKLVQDMFAFRLESSHLEAGLMLALTQKESLELPAYPGKVGKVMGVLLRLNNEKGREIKRKRGRV